MLNLRVESSWNIWNLAKLKSPSYFPAKPSIIQVVLARLKLIYRLKMVNSMFWPRAQPTSGNTGLAWSPPFRFVEHPMVSPGPPSLPACRPACLSTSNRCMYSDTLSPKPGGSYPPKPDFGPKPWFSTNLPVRVWLLSCFVCPSKTPIHLVDLNYVTLAFKDTNSVQACCNFCFSLSRPSCILSLSSGCSGALCLWQYFFAVSPF